MFSEKYGYKAEKAIQHDCISDVLRRRIWNLFSQQEIKAGGLASKRLSQALNGEQTIEEKIVDRMGFLIDTGSKDATVESQLKNNILKFFNWFEIYDFIDIHISFLTDDERDTNITNYLNKKRQDIELLRVKWLR